MKTNLRLYTLLILCSTFLINTTKAQHCAGVSGSGVCSPQTSLTVPGFAPTYDNLPCSIDGVPYDTVITFLAPTTAPYSGLTATIDWIKIDSIENLPCGLCWRTNLVRDSMSGGQRACIRITGTTYDAPGQYKMRLIVDIKAHVGFITQTLVKQNGEQYGIKYWAKVKAAPSATCITVDTLAVGNTRTNPGSIAPVSITGNSTVCSGSSTTLTATGGTYNAYVWSTGALTSSISVSAAGTYTVTVYGSCSSATATKTITSPNVTLTLATSGPTTFCTGGSVTLDAGAGFATYAWSNSAATQTINVTQSGTYKCTVTSGGCTGTSNTVTVTVNTNPTPTISSNGPVTFCQGGTVTLNAGAGYTTYAWSNSTSNQTLATTQSGVFTCTVTQNGCSGTSNTITVTVNNNPAPVVTANGPVTFCQGSNVTLDAGAGYATYAWSNSTSNQTLVATQSGNYKCTVTQNGCSGTSNTITVTVNNNPVPIVTAGGPVTFCQGGTVTLDAGAGYAVYAWSNNTSNQTLSATQSGNYTCTVTQNGCTGTSNTITVTVNANPTPTITPWTSTSICAGSSVTLDAGGGYSSYSWSNGGTNQTISASQTGNYSCTVTQNGCSGSTSPVSVTVTDPTPTVTASGPLTFCTGGNVVLDAGAGFSSYAWSNGAGSNQTATITTSGTYVVSVTKNNCPGVSSATVVTVTSNTLNPAITANPSLNICPGGSTTLDAGTGYTAYAWSSTSSAETINVNSAGTYTVTVSQGSCTGTASVTVNVGNFPVAVSISPAGPVSVCQGDVVPLNAGAVYDSYAWSNNQTTADIDVSSSADYILTVTQNACIGTDTVSVIVNQLPVPSITPSGNTNACTGDVLNLDAGTGFTSYNWSNGAQTQSAQPVQSGTYTVTVTQNSCSGSASVSVTFNAHPVVAITPAGTVRLCEGEALSFDAGAGFAAYSWSNSSAGQTIQPTTSGTYIVTVTQNGCTGVDSVQAVFKALPHPVVSPAGSNVCEGTPVVFDAGNGFASYLWSNNTATQTIEPVTSGTYYVTVTQNGCTGVDSVVAVFKPTPLPSISPAGTSTSCSGDLNTFDAGAGFDTYSWSNNSNTQIIHPTVSETYIVTVTLNGCPGIDSVHLNIQSLPVTDISPAGTFSLCNGDSITLDAGSGFSAYHWSNNDTNQTITVSSSSIYGVTVSQNGCSGGSSNSVNVSAHVAPVASLGISSIAGSIYNLRALPSSGVSYIWEMAIGGDTTAGTATLNTNLDSTSVDCVQGGYYRVIVSGLNSGCTDTSRFILVPTCVGFYELSNEVRMTLMPNPANEVLNVSYYLNSAAVVSLSIIDLTGRKISEVINEPQTSGKHEHQIQLSRLTAGIYLLNFTNGYGSLNTRFAKQ